MTAPIRSTAAPAALLFSLVLASVAAAAATGHAGHAVQHTATADGDVAAHVSGVIEGSVTLPNRVQRRTVNRYAGSGDATARILQDVPNVVYLEGAVTGGDPARQARWEMAQQDTAFEPAVLIIPVGTTVAFPNRDAFFHNVFSYSATKRFDLGRYARGESKSVNFDRPGISKVYCEVHQYMRAAIIVVENPHFAVVGDDGRFVLRDVPPGRHRLVVWDIERRPQTVDVTVTSGATARVNVTLQ
jgi:plastocyanin